MAKMNRERAVKEKRARKQEKKDEKKQAALDARDETVGGEDTVPAIAGEPAGATDGGAVAP